MAHSIPFNRVTFETTTTGTGAVTVGAAVDGYCTPAEAGITDGTVATWLIRDGDDFEIVQGAYTASGTTFARTTVRLSKIGGTPGTSKINLSGSAVVSIVECAEDIGLQLIDYEEFTSNDTWSKPAGAKLVFVQVVGGGGAGASGTCGSSASNRPGGGGGGAGMVVEDWFHAASLSSTESVTVGASVTGATGVTHGTAVTGTTGNNGNPSAFGNLLKAFGGIGGSGHVSSTANGGTPGLWVATGRIDVTDVGALWNAANGAPGRGGNGQAGSQGVGGARGGLPQFLGGGPGGGGGGGGISTTNTVFDGGAGGAGHDGAGGGAFSQTSTAIGGGGTAGTGNASSPTAGGAGTAGTSPFFGAGGGGGGAAQTATGAAGGAGAAPGGGGGGGGATRESQTSGAGGNGARGAVRVWTYG